MRECECVCRRIWTAELGERSELRELAAFERSFASLSGLGTREQSSDLDVASRVMLLLQLD